MNKRGIKKYFNREIISYTFWGLLTALLNIVIFEIGVNSGIDYWLANAAALLITKLAAYLVNKFFVFRTHCKNLAGLLLEIGRFVVSRSATMLIDYGGLILFVELLGIDKKAGKYLIACVVVIMNYILGKKAVFRDVS